MDDERIQEIKAQLPAVRVEATPQPASQGRTLDLRDLQAWLLVSDSEWDYTPTTGAPDVKRSAAYCFAYKDVQ